MGLFHFEENANYRYGIWKIEENEIKLRHLIGNEITTSYKNPGKRIEFLSVRALAGKMDIDPLSIDHMPSGKPFLKNSKTAISISHTKGYAAIMLSDLRDIGTDIEHTSDRIIKVRHKFMHPEEEEAISRLTKDQTIALLLHWSAKESLFKANTDEGVDFIRDLRIFDFTAPMAQGRFKGKALRSGKDFLIDYRVEENYVTTSCFPFSSSSSMI
ncbi:MAG: 4'-phosphopantetheinyl transferase superfamily protein [Bacteroidales bacterium]|nr:4'-phosphopantetheinyl transferase superfamily protein [Bacteroidales bacterium]